MRQISIQDLSEHILDTNQSWTKFWEKKDLKYNLWEIYFPFL